jgi:hypothetical protein
MFKRLPWMVLLLPALAWAVGVELAVGQTQVLDVGASRGLVCDDLSIVSVELKTDPESNTNKVTLKGLKPGNTTCRAGNVALGSPVRIFEVSVHTKAD